MTPPDLPPVQADEQLLYARAIAWGGHAGLAVLVPAFAAYVFGLLPGLVPVQRLPALWSHPVATYLQEAGMPRGWGWAALLQHGDMLGLLGIAMLAGCSMAGLLLAWPLYARRGERAMALICVAEVVVILLAASGWTGKGH